MTAAASNRRDRLRARLADLKMPGALEALDGVLAQVDSGTVTAGDAIEQVLNAQIALRNNRRLQAAMRSSRPAAASRSRPDPLAGRRHVGGISLEERPDGTQRGEGGVEGPVARGRAPRAGRSRLAGAQTKGKVEARAAGELSRRRVLTYPALLVVDEIGYLPVSQDGAVLFFQLINARHEQASTVLTSNKGFEEWGGVLGDEVMAAALIDRLLHHCHIVNIRGNSYRIRQHQDWLRSASEQRPEGVAR